ncbi:MAG: tetratricopeptide repeat protein, partial [Actinomycetales bacterium]|nr:tetratricopeptide repeat protein [Actinomycetales bacterium]
PGDPGRDVARTPSAALAHSPAVALLVERSRAVRPGFTVTSGNSAAVVSLCRRLDGLPLAIELAAVQLGRHEPEELVAQLAARTVTLRAEAVDVPGRHRTLRETVEWSTGRLPVEDRLLLGVLGAFRGDPEVAMVQTVLAASGLDVPDPQGSLVRLAGASLVSLTPPPGAASREPRVGLLDTIREVAADLLAASGHDHPVRAVHARVMLDLVRSDDPDRAYLPNPAELAPVDAHVDDVLAALAWTTGGAAGEEPRRLLDTGLVIGLAHYLVVRGRFAESRRLLSAVAATTPDPTAAGVAYFWAAGGAHESGDHRATLDLVARAEAVCPDLGRVDGRCALLTLVAAARRSLGEIEAAHRAELESLEIAERVGSRRYVAKSLNNLGNILRNLGRYQEAEQYMGRCLEINREVGDARGVGIARYNLGSLFKETGRFPTARDHLVDAVDCFRGLGEPLLQSIGLGVLAEVLVGLGERAEATAAATEAIELAGALQSSLARTFAEVSLGDLALAAGDAVTAEQRYRTAGEYATAPDDVARIRERLAALLVGQDPGEAGLLLDRADELRRTSHCRRSPVDQPRVSETRARLAHG